MKLFSAILAASTLFSSSVFAQRDYGNWLKAFGSDLAAYQASPGLPSIFQFTVLTSNLDGSGSLVWISSSASPAGSGSASETKTHRLYLSSIIPTPGLCTSSTGGTTGIRCAADASKSSAGQGESLNQVRQRVPGHSDASPGSTARPPLPTFRLLPYPPVFPDAPAALPPNPVCDAIHDEPLVVVEHLDNQVQIIGSCSGKALATIPNITLPLQVDIMQDLSHAIVTSFPGALYFIDLSTYKVSSVMSLNLHNPSGIAISPDGKLAYVTDYGDTGALLVIDIQKQQIVNSIPTPVYPQGVFLTPDGTRAWVTFPFSQEVMVFDTLTLTLVKTLGANEPKTIAFNSTGTLAFLVYHASNTVAVIDATTFAAVRSIPTGAGANEIGIAPDDSFAAVNCYDGSQLTIINLSNYSSVTMSLPGQPLGLSLRY